MMMDAAPTVSLCGTAINNLFYSDAETQDLLSHNSGRAILSSRCVGEVVEVSEGMEMVMFFF